MNIIPIPKKVECRNEYLKFDGFIPFFSGFYEQELSNCMTYLKSFAKQDNQPLETRNEGEWWADMEEVFRLD